MSDRDVVIRVEGVSKLYRLGEVGTGSLAHDVNRWWHKVRGKEDPYLKIGEVNDRTRPAKAAGAKEPEDRPSEVADALHGPRRSKLETAEGGGEGTAGGNQLADAGDSQSEWSGSFEGPSSSSLGSGPAKTQPDRAPVVPASASSSVLIREFDSLDPSRLALRADLRSLHLAPAPALDCGKNSSAPATSYSPPVTPKAPACLLDRHHLCRHRSIPRPRPLPPRYAALDSAHGRVGELTAAAARSR